ncbi:MAG: hypothetical protein B7Y95_18040 [Rhizobiales bacterium 32-66-11]|nr:MAG: hypothetical protein B7Y95_18040 [Rhizobiales bacterium 32-66-11]
MAPHPQNLNLPLNLVGRTLLSGSAVALATTMVLALRARAEGRHPIQPLNATSHWYLGEAAGRSRALDLRHTLGGFLTHHAASLLWAGVFEGLRLWRPQSNPLGDAAAVSALAAFVDYAVVPKRLTPGWEQVVTPKSITLAYVAMGLVLATTAMCRRRDVP